MIFVQNPKYSFATGFRTPVLSLPLSIKQHINDLDSNMVDQSLKLWNTFFDIVLKREPILKLIYETLDNQNRTKKSE